MTWTSNIPALCWVLRGKMLEILPGPDLEGAQTGDGPGKSHGQQVPKRLALLRWGAIWEGSIGE